MNQIQITGCAYINIILSKFHSANQIQITDYADVSAYVNIILFKF